MKDSTLAALLAHKNTGRVCGTFVTAVLENNLRESMGQADEQNRADLFEIVAWCYNELPGNSWGNVERVRAWREVGGIEGLKRQGLVHNGTMVVKE